MQGDWTLTARSIPLGDRWFSRQVLSVDRLCQQLIETIELLRETVILNTLPGTK